MKRTFLMMNFDIVKRIIIRMLLIFAILMLFIVKGGMAMAEQSTSYQIEQLQKEVKILKDKFEILGTQDAANAKALLDALKAMVDSQRLLNTAQAQLPFAELQGIREGTTGLNMPKGNDGTIKLSAGEAGAELLRSRQPILECLDSVASDLAELCPADTVILREEELEQALRADFTLKRIKYEAGELKKATENVKLTEIRPKAFALPAVIAGAYTLGIAFDTINSLAKLLRVNRQLNIISSEDKDVLSLLEYLLELKGNGFTVSPGMLGNKTIAEADSLLKQMKDLADEVQNANNKLAMIKPGDQINKEGNLPTAESISSLKSEITNATSLLDGLHPSKNPDAFWTQVKGQVISANIEKKARLFIETKAKAVQVTESRWYTSERIIVSGEILVKYRLLKEDGTLDKSGIILKASKANNTKIDDLDDLDWRRPEKSVTKADKAQTAAK